jgi:DNA mismatch repair ATPase MutL
MSAEEARLAVERHATSKIRSADDLGAIATLVPR